MAGYIGPIPVPQATQTRETFTATASQTTFNTAGYQPGYLDVFMNGVKLIDGSDYTATNGSDVVLSSGAAINDLIEVVAYTAFEVLNQNFTGTTTVADLTVTGDLTVDGTTTTINSTTLNVDDINITVASGAADAAAANGAGLTVDGANATFNYASSGDKWTMNKPLDVSENLSISSSSLGILTLTSSHNGAYIRFRDSTSSPSNQHAWMGVAGNEIRLFVNDSEYPVAFNSGGALFNPQGGDNDFRVLSDVTNYALFVDGGANSGYGRVKISSSTISTNTSTLGGDADTYINGLTIENNEASYTNGGLSLVNKYDWGYGSSIDWQNVYDEPSGNLGVTNRITSQWRTGSHYSLDFFSMRSGSLVEHLSLGFNQSVFNEDSLDQDFRVESVSNANMLLVDAGNNSVAINRSYGVAPLHVSGTPSDTVSAANAYAKITAQGLDGLAIGSRSSSPFTAWLQSGYTANGYTPEMNNGYPLALNPLNANVVIGATNVADSTDGLSIVSGSRDNLSIMYTGTAGGHASAINFRDKRGAVNARISNNLQDDGIGTAGAHLEFHTAVGGTLSERVSIGGTNQPSIVFNDPGYDYDFRVESDSNTHTMFVDAGTDMVNFRTSGSAYLQKGAGMDAAINVNGSAYIGSGHYRVIANPNGKVFTLDTAGNGQQAFLHLQGSQYNGYRDVYYWATNYSGSWTVYSNTNASSGSMPTYTIGNNSSTNPTITLAFSTGYSGGYVSVRMSNHWSVS